MNDFIGKKVLITTDRWFVAPDGKDYQAAYGTLKSINEAGKTLGFIPNRAHANWFYEIGDMIIMGCQVMYIVLCNEDPNFNDAEIWDSTGGYVKKDFRPSKIYKCKEAC